MVHSAEVRWFVRAPLPEDVFGWFCRNRPLQPETRTDRYLIFPGCETVGVKQRGGASPAFEVKARRGGIEPVRFPGGVTGRASAWVKWSCGGAATAAWIGSLEADAATWVAVAKTRWIRVFTPEGAETTGEAMPGAGCSVELARVQASRDPWWSLGVEAYGPPERVWNTLGEVARRFFEEPPPYLLHAACSLAYPAWLGGEAGGMGASPAYARMP